jgi:hypothetical protein
MALDAKDLQQVAALLGEALGPKIREAVAEQVTTRLDAALLQVHERFDAALIGLKGEVGTSLAETAGLLAEVTSSLNVLREQVRGYHDEHLASLETVTKRADALAEGLGAFATKEQIQALQDRVAEESLETEKDIADVRAAIPELPAIPAPVALVEGGELSAQMREAMEIAAKQVFTPLLAGTAHASKEAIELAMKQSFEFAVNAASDAQAAAAVEIEKLAVSVTKDLTSLHAAADTLNQRVTAAAAEANVAAQKAGNEAIEFAKRAYDDVSTKAAETLGASLHQRIEERFAGIENSVTAQLAADATEIKTLKEFTEKGLGDLATGITKLAETTDGKFASVSLKLDALAEGVAGASAAAVAVAEKATSTMVTEIVEQAVKEAQRTATETFEAAMPGLTQHAKAAAVGAVPDAVAVALPGLLPTTEALAATVVPAAEAAAAKVATEAGNATLVAARAAAEATAEAFAERAATEAAQTAAVTAVDAMRASLAEELNPAPLVDKAVAAALPQVIAATAQAAQAVILEAQEGVASAVGSSVEALRVGLVEELNPAPLVEQQFIAVLPGLARTASEAASEACTVSIERAKEGIAANVKTAVDALRTGLVEELNPALLVEALVPSAVKEEVALGIKTALSAELPRVEVQLEAKLNAAVDRIPKPRDGLDGTAGADGVDGKDGKDARFTQPLPYESGKTYEFGAWVTHDSGVWVAARRQVTTAPGEATDWDCVLPGVKAVKTSMLEDGRTVHMTCLLADGSTHEDKFRLDIPLVRGVYAENREYEKDDICTFDGSWWVAQKSGALPRPGSDGTAWRLTVKRGKDGKDLKQPAPQVIRHAGDWQDGIEYPVNVTVDHAGVRWLAMRSNRERPPFVTLMSNDTWTKLGT